MRLRRLIVGICAIVPVLLISPAQAHHASFERLEAMGITADGKSFEIEVEYFPAYSESYYSYWTILYELRDGDTVICEYDGGFSEAYPPKGFLYVHLGMTAAYLKAPFCGGIELTWVAKEQTQPSVSSQPCLVVSSCYLPYVVRYEVYRSNAAVAYGALAGDEARAGFDNGSASLTAREVGAI